MNDYIIRASAANATIRAFAATTKNMIECSRSIHNLSPAATIALGRMLTATAMMSCFGKGEIDTLTLQIRADGPLGGIVCVGSRGMVRGYVHNPLVESIHNSSGNINIGAVVGKNGHLNVIRDIGMKEPYIGFTKLASGEIAEDLSRYFAYSEQIPTVVSLGVRLDKENHCVAEAGGFMIQLMPNAEVETVDLLEQRIQKLTSITSMLKEGMTTENILESILGDMGLLIHESYDTQYQCNCSRERMRDNLITLGQKEIKDIIHDTGEAELQCHFCNTYYRFDKEELKEIIKLCNCD